MKQQLSLLCVATATAQPHLIRSSLGWGARDVVLPGCTGVWCHLCPGIRICSRVRALLGTGLPSSSWGLLFPLQPFRNEKGAGVWLSSRQSACLASSRPCVPSRHRTPTPTPNKRKSEHEEGVHMGKSFTSELGNTCVSRKDNLQ